jgi:hypothetical protein
MSFSSGSPAGAVFSMKAVAAGPENVETAGGGSATKGEKDRDPWG